jgi:hypothetical protein
MEKAEIAAKVSLEKVIHNGLNDLIQNFWDEHKILINSIGIDWLNISTRDRQQFVIERLTINSETHQK